MSKYTPLEVLRHIRDEAGFLQHLGSSRTWEAFFADPVARRAAVRAIEVVGEATKKLPPDLRARYPEVPWSRMARMRDRMIHDYIEVDYGFVWDVCLRDAAALLAQVDAILAAEAPGDG